MTLEDFNKMTPTDFNNWPTFALAQDIFEKELGYWQQQAASKTVLQLAEQIRDNEYDKISHGGNQVMIDMVKASLLQINYIEIAKLFYPERKD